MLNPNTTYYVSVPAAEIPKLESFAKELKLESCTFLGRKRSDSDPQNHPGWKCEELSVMNKFLRKIAGRIHPSKIQYFLSRKDIAVECYVDFIPKEEKNAMRQRT